MRRAGLLAAACLALLGAACDSDRPVAEPGPSAYCPAPPAILVNAQGLAVPPAALRGEGADWESAFAYGLETWLGTPRRLAGRPAMGAQAYARLELLANSFEANERFRFANPSALFHLRQARAAVRAALGIAPDRPPAEVAAALFAAECAFWADDRGAAALALGSIGGAAMAMDHLAPPGGAAPPVPRAAVTAAGVVARATTMR